MTAWLSTDDVRKLPASGAAYQRVLAAANKTNYGSAIIRDSSYEHNGNCLAGALIYAHAGNASMRDKVKAELGKLPGTEKGSQIGGNQPVLAVSRKLGSYTVAAELVGDPAFVTYAHGLLDYKFSDGTIKQVHERRPNNWGTSACISRVLVDLAAKDNADLARAMVVLTGWLGNRTAYAGFDYGDLAWQADPAHPVGINLAGSTIKGKSVSGVLPDDQRRAGGFTWPPPCENYVRSAIGSIVAAIWALSRNGGVNLTAASDSAIKRAVEWYTGTVDGKAACKFDGDDGWIPYVYNQLGYTKIKTGDGTDDGKEMSWTGWTHATPIAPTPPPTPTPTDPCLAQRDAVKTAQATLDAAKAALASCEQAHG